MGLCQELRERDEMIAGEQDQCHAAQRMVEEARAMVTVPQTNVEIYLERNRWEDEYKASLIDINRHHEERSRMLTTLQAEQQKTCFMSSSLTQLKEEIAEHDSRYQAFVKGVPRDEVGKQYYKTLTDVCAMRLRDAKSS